jgi:hypothetical protein
MCTSGCDVSNYQVSSSSSVVVSVTGLDASASLSSDGLTMELEVDTSSLSTISFFLRAELTSSPTIYAFSDQLQIQITCGSELVSVTGSPLSIILEADSSIYTQSLISHFSSSTSLCDIVGYQGLTSSSLATIFSNPSISLSTG